MSKKITFEIKFKSYKTQIEKKTPSAYQWIRILFIKKRINIKTATRLMFNLTYTHKNSKLYKNTLIELNQLIEEYEQDKLNKNKENEHVININESNRQIYTSQGAVDRYGYWIHKNEVHDMMKSNPNTIIIHKVEFYIYDIKQDKITLIWNDETG